MNSNSLTQTYTPTFLEKLLGKNYKWWYLITFWIKSKTVYFWSEFFVSLNRTLTLLGTCLIFLYFASDEKTILNYLLIGSVFFAASDPVMSWGVTGSIKNGSIVKWLIYPNDYIKILFFNGLANCFYLFLTCLVGLVPLILIFYNNLDFSNNLLIFIPLLMLSFAIRFCIQIITGFVTFWFTDGSGINHLIQNSENFLSGSIFPLYILPYYLGWLEYTPFAYTFYHPMQIYLGKYDTNQTILVFLGGIFWCFALYLLARFVFKAGLKRNEAVGL